MLQGKAKKEINNLLEDDEISPEEAAFLTGYLEYWFQNNFKQKLFLFFMKLLAFVDPHLNKIALNKIKEKAIKHKPDLLVCCGDITFFGQGLDKVGKFLNDLNIKILIIPGNHESTQEIKSLCSKYKNLINIHKGLFQYKEFSFFGWGTGGFSYIEEEFERLVKQFKKEVPKIKKLIFVTHAPIHGTSTDVLSNKHLGCKSTRKFIEDFQPVLVLCGHFHETFNKQDKIKKSLILNPGPFGTIIEIK